MATTFQIFRMTNMWKKGIILLGALLISLSMAAQDKEVRKLLRKGNKQYRDSLYTPAEVYYRKAMDKQPGNADISYNLGTTLMMRSHQTNKRNSQNISRQQAQNGTAREDTILKQAYEELLRAAKLEKDKKKSADIYRNIGVILQGQQQLKECIEAYKKSLRNDPTDDEVRYNLALAQKQLKDQNNQNNQQQQQKQDKQQEQKEQQQQQDQQNNPQNKPQQQNQMSKDAANQLLNSIMQEERKVQEKAKQGMRVKGRKLEKDW